MVERETEDLGVSGSTPLPSAVLRRSSMAERRFVKPMVSRSSRLVSAMNYIRHIIRTIRRYLCRHVWSRPYEYQLCEISGEDEHVVHEGLRETKLCIKCHEAQSRWLS